MHNDLLNLLPNYKKLTQLIQRSQKLNFFSIEHLKIYESYFFCTNRMFYKKYHKNVSNVLIHIACIPMIDISTNFQVLNRSFEICDLEWTFQISSPLKSYVNPWIRDPLLQYGRRWFNKTFKSIIPIQKLCVELPRVL